MPCKATGEAPDFGQKKGKAEASVFMVFSVEKAWQGRVYSLGMAILNNSNGLWAIKEVFSCLVPGPGML